MPSAGGRCGVDSRSTTRLTPEKTCRVPFGMRERIILSSSAAADLPSSWKSGSMLDIPGDTLSHTYGSLSIPRTETLPGTDIPADFAAAITSVARMSFAARIAAG